MRKFMAGLLLVGILTGCTSDWDPQRQVSPTATGAEADLNRTIGARPRSSAGFAGLPDRGELIAYADGVESRQRGAYTSHPVEISEDHALRASRTDGELALTAPDGEPLRFRYDHHIEHPDGNWSWIGRNEDGLETILTFGEKAVFGMIPSGNGDTLRVTTSAGRVWLVSSDRSREPDINDAASRSGNPDYLIPPSLASSLGSLEAQAPAMAAQEVTRTSAANTIDVVLGFTNGYAAQLGGESQAVTRLTNLVVIANQAMVNSQVVGRLRLVRAIQVTYPDNTANSQTLEQLTGFRSGAGQIPVPEALQPLRAARDEFGGDLVALVRAFRTPENDGCGIAWLIGGGQGAFTTNSAPFGYAVVSDGSDRDERDNITYLCREDTLGHEFGHNLGQAHNIEDSTRPGVHVYSYGYREASPTGFYTVMSYRLRNSSQTSILHFANPAVSVAGRPTGIADSADNVRSMNQTIPVVAEFRARTVPFDGDIGSDLNGDTRDDIVWHNPGADRAAFWLMNGSQIAGSAVVDAQPGLALIGTGDFNGDGRSEVLWDGDGTMYRSTFTGAGFTAIVIGFHEPGWIPQAAGDLNGDGRDDIIWHNPGENRMAYWLMDGNTIIDSAVLEAPQGLVLIGTGDFDGNDRAELLWDGNGTLYTSTFTGSEFTGATIGTRDPGWIPQVAGDLNGDGRDDIVFHNPAVNRLAYWLMRGNAIVASAVVDAPAGLTLRGSGDFDGDGRAELLWAGGGGVYSSTFDGSGFNGAALGSYDPGWIPTANAMH